MADKGPTTHKCVAVINKKIEHGKVMNALAHACIGLAGLADEEQKKLMRFQDYIDANDGVHPSISDNPFIILKADNSNKIRKVRNGALEKGLLFTDFTSTMTVGTYLEQQERTKNALEEELEYWCIVLFGTPGELKELTRKFSLWQ